MFVDGRCTIGMSASSACAALVVPTSDSPGVVALDVEYINFEPSITELKEFHVPGEVSVGGINGDQVGASPLRPLRHPLVCICGLLPPHSSFDANNVHCYVVAQPFFGLHMNAWHKKDLGISITTGSRVAWVPIKFRIQLSKHACAHFRADRQGSVTVRAKPVAAP